MVDVARRQKLPGRNWFDSSANQNSVHNDIVADAEASHGELVFGRNILWGSVVPASEFDSFSGFQVGEGDQNVVAGIELEHAGMHQSFKASLPGHGTGEWQSANFARLL